jgi:hypothetical protein
MVTEQKIDFDKVPEGKISYISSEIPDYEYFVENWKEDHGEDSEVPGDGSQEYWDWVNDMQELDFDDFKGNFPYTPLAGKLCLVHGYFGGWDGHRDGGKVMRMDSADDLFKCVAGHADRVDVYLDADGLHVTNCHHDGTDHYQVEILTEAGERWWRDEGEEGQDRETHSTLLNTEGYTRKVDFYLM